MSQPQPKSIGKYGILGVLGKGAMGLVYRAEDPHLRRQVAIKVITGDEVTDEMKGRFQVEARAAAALDHPNIVVVYDLGEHEGVPYIAMELLKGEDLRAHVRRRPDLSLNDTLRLMVQVCDGLAYAHDRKIVHRDIKPANIHVCPDGRVKIVDFGVAKMESTSLTKTGMVIGTPDYMSPEQIQGRAVDARSDIFAAGVVLYELLARSKPFSAESITSVIYNIVYKTPQTFTEMNVSVPPAIERIVARAMSKDLDARYQDIREMATDIRRFLGEAPEESVGSEDATAVLSSGDFPSRGPLTATVARTDQIGGGPDTRAGGGAAGTATVAGGPAGAVVGPATTVGQTVSLGQAPTVRRPWALIGIGAAVLVGAVIAAVLLMGGDPAPAPLGAAVSVQVIVSPWAQVDSLERTGEGGGPVDLGSPKPVTPVRLDLPPGHYKMSVSNPVLGVADPVEFDVTGNTVVKHVLAGFDPEEAVASFGAAP